MKLWGYLKNLNIHLFFIKWLLLQHALSQTLIQEFTSIWKTSWVSQQLQHYNTPFTSSVVALADQVTTLKIYQCKWQETGEGVWQKSRKNKKKNLT